MMMTTKIFELNLRNILWVQLTRTGDAWTKIVPLSRNLRMVMMTTMMMITENHHRHQS